MPGFFIRNYWIHTALLAATVIAPGAGCQSTSTRSQPPAIGDDQSNGARSAISQLRALANADRTGTSIDIQPDDPDLQKAIQPHAEDDQRAMLHWPEARRNLEASWTPPQVRSPKPPSDTVMHQTGRLYRQAREQFLEGRSFESIRLLEEVLKLDPGAVAAMRLLAENHLATTGPSRALRLYEDILVIHPEDADALVRVGSAAWQRRRIDQAAGFLGRAFDQLETSSDAPGEAQLWLLAALDLGQLLFEQRFDQAGVEVWESFWSRLERDGFTGGKYQTEIDRIHRRRAILETELGDALMRLGRFEDAARRYASAYKQARQEFGQLLKRRVIALSRAGRVPQAMLLLIAALDNPDTSEQAVELIGSMRSSEHQAIFERALTAQLRANPEDLRYVEAVAQLRPEANRDAVILEYLDAHGSDLKAIKSLIPWMTAQIGREAALRTVLDYAIQTDADASPLIDELVALENDGGAYLDMLDKLSDEFASKPAFHRFHTQFLLRTHRLPEALETARQLHERFPADLRSRLLLAQSFIELRMDERASPLLTDLPIKSEDAVSWHYDRALLLARLGLEPQALALLDDLEDSPLAGDINPVIHLQRRAKLMTTAGDVQPAARALAQAIEMEPTNESSYGPLMRLFGLGGPLQDAGKFGEVTRALFSNVPTSPTLVLLRAEQDAARGRFDDAISACQGLMADNPDDAAALSVLVDAWIESGRTDEAIDWVSKRLEQRPGDPMWRDAYIQVLTANASISKASAALRDRIELAPFDLDARQQLERILESTGREEEALDLMHERWQIMPQSTARELAFAELALRRDQATDALTHLYEAVKVAGKALPGQIESIILQATRVAEEPSARDDSFDFIVRTVEQLLDDGADLSRTSRLGYINALVALDPDVDRIQRAVDRTSASDASIRSEQMTLVVLTLARQEQTDAAITLADRWLSAPDIALNEDTVVVLHWRLVQSVLQNDPEAAIRTTRIIHDAAQDLYESVPILNPQSRDRNAESSLAESLYQIAGQFSLGDQEDSQSAILRAALQADPDHALANNDLGYALAEQGQQLEEAEQMLIKATLAQPTNSAILDSLGWVRYKLGILDDLGDEVHEFGAIRLLEQAALFRRAERTMLRDDPVVLDHLGDAYWRAGRDDDAQSAWQRAVEAYDAQLSAAQEAAAQIGPEGVQAFKDHYGPIAGSARRKLEAARNQREPEVAPSPVLDNNHPN